MKCKGNGLQMWIRLWFIIGFILFFKPDFCLSDLFHPIPVLYGEMSCMSDVDIITWNKVSKFYFTSTWYYLEDEKYECTLVLEMLRKWNKNKKFSSIGTYNFIKWKNSNFLLYVSKIFNYYCLIYKMRISYKFSTNSERKIHGKWNGYQILSNFLIKNERKMEYVWNLSKF